MNVEAIKRWLKALETERDNYFHGDTDGAPEYLYEAIAEMRQAIEALAQPEKKFVTIVDGPFNHRCPETPLHIKEMEPEQEPDDLTIAYMAGLQRGKDLGHDEAVRGVAMRWEEALTEPIPAPGVMNEPLESLYRRTEALRQRTWVDLTEAELLELYKQFTDSDQWTYEKAIQAKLKEKNT